MGTTALHVDNTSCMALAKNSEAQERTTHVEIQYHFVRHHVALNRVRLQYCPMGDMLADMLTNRVTRAKLVEVLKEICLGARESIKGDPCNTMDKKHLVDSHKTPEAGNGKKEKDIAGGESNIQSPM